MVFQLDFSGKKISDYKFQIPSCNLSCFFFIFKNKNLIQFRSKRLIKDYDFLKASGRNRYMIFSVLIYMTQFFKPI